MLVLYFYLKCTYMYMYTALVHNYNMCPLVYIIHVACIMYYKAVSFSSFVSMTLYYCDNCAPVATGSSPERMASSGSNWRLPSLGLCTHRPPTAVSSHTSSTPQNLSSYPSRRLSMTMWWVFTSGTVSEIEPINCYRSTITHQSRAQ